MSVVGTTAVDNDTPDTKEVRGRFAWDERVSDYHPGDKEAFDRWLRGVKAQAWEEGQQAQFAAISTRGVTVDLPVNPYRDTPTETD